MNLSDVRAARELLDGVIEYTPIAHSRWLSERAGTDVVLKAENLQRTGSFKIRGAYVRIARLTEVERARGVVAASAGNHAQGVALAASMLGTQATIFMPNGAALPKVAATEGYGAEVRFHGSGVTEALVPALEFAESTGAVLIHPFDHEDIVAGQGTVGLEILEQVPDVRTILVPLGGGGLTAGIALLKTERPDIRIVGVQAEEAAAFPGSLAGGKPVAAKMRPTMADGIAVAQPGSIPFEIVAEHLDEVITVSEEALSRALIGLLERAKFLVEPAGIAAVAALLERPGDFEGPVVPVLSGGNVDALLLLDVIRHGLVAGGRFMALKVRISDRPGALMGLLSDLASLQVNVQNVNHDRASDSLLINQVDVDVQFATRGPQHRAEVQRRLVELGYVLV
ncbi:threonine ammonia-lyase [Aeromicrobium sp. CF3.5]|uniref:threonine ammonia-lyase n=1 Tax=Aeromicrobium sp. CF3.5 TaxID=3373078 RepID=UPI003EE4CE5B